mgnify:FL=1
MTLECTLSNDNHDLTINMARRFDCNVMDDFKATYTPEKPGLNYIIDMSTTEHMDVAALGMLLNIRRALGGDTAISIINCHPNIKKILLMSKFDRKFIIE